MLKLIVDYKSYKKRAKNR